MKKKKNNILFNSASSSNDAQVRCNFVDFYYALFGPKVPNCLNRPESTGMTMGLPKIPKLSDAKRPSTPFDNHIEPIAIEKRRSMERDEGVKRQFESINDHAEIKEEPVDNIKVIETLKFHHFHQFH